MSKLEKAHSDGGNNDNGKDKKIRMVGRIGRHADKEPLTPDELAKERRTHSDVMLVPEGWQRARDVAVPIDNPAHAGYYSSPKRRTHETGAAKVLQGIGKFPEGVEGQDATDIPDAVDALGVAHLGHRRGM